MIITSSLRVGAEPCLRISIFRRIGPCDALTMFLSHMVFSTHMYFKYDQQIKMEKEVWRKHPIDLTTSQTKQLALVFLSFNPVFEFLQKNLEEVSMFELDLNVTKIIKKIPIAKKGCYKISIWGKKS